MKIKWLTRTAWVFLALLAVLSLIAPWLPIADYRAMDPDARLVAPQWTTAPMLGTDAQGRDMLARLLWGARISLFVGLFGTIVAMLVGVPYGAFAGYRGGRWDRTLMRLADALESIPMVVFVLFLMSILQEYRAELAFVGFGRLQLFLVAIGLLFWLPTARVARAEALRIRQLPYVMAARSAGMRGWPLLRSHILPNMMPALRVMLLLTLPRVILMEAFLSFLGLGVEPPAVSWGGLASDGLAAMNPLVGSAWLMLLPSGVLALTLLALQRVGASAKN
ncbi:MAG: ABC transporter permease [Planctomycetes bacterium]|nr:ABC transporter permease [Planctomycetota bacterium]MCP4770702.1 ABC transporter permease [Planctomycetota bacterium]MCP4861417.1 ABC transporter permease [Planctomycetota bacterium]